MALSASDPASRATFLDSVAVIYYLNGDMRADVLEPVLSRAEAGDEVVYVSAVTVTEVLSQPLRDNDRTAEAAARLFLSMCDVVPFDSMVGERAAVLRARYGLRTPDALIIASTLSVEAARVVGNDDRWKRVAEIDYVHLDDRPSDLRGP